jgi:hypothetical protein
MIIFSEVIIDLASVICKDLFVNVLKIIDNTIRRFSSMNSLVLAVTCSRVFNNLVDDYLNS